MKRVSIEQALQWAYRDQMVHVALPEGVPVEASRTYALPKLASLDFGLDPVDSSPRSGFAAAPDAHIIHRAVMALDPVERRRSQEEIEMRYARGLFDCELRQENNNASWNAVRPDASEVVHVRNLVFSSAFHRRRPDPILEPIYLFERGRRVFTDNTRRWGYHMLRSVGDDMVEVIVARAHYSLWRAALIRLRERIIEQLRAHRLTEELPFGLENEGT
ncbi:MAG: hypothetical protein ISS15_05410 [Alphaproteobacteria bacterium]|nr:hypothetical protein [Alphaproteobacteria bacterium]MBL6939442.1 hypothetical protein [Alphaproteobacteria bacterium]MBL7097077.1 hypothetical protein [Alphaproteobacteria bacterium]